MVIHGARRRLVFDFGVPNAGDFLCCPVSDRHRASMESNGCPDICAISTVVIISQRTVAVSAKGDLVVLIMNVGVRTFGY